MRPRARHARRVHVLARWNSFLWPLVVATTEDKYTLPVALALFSIGQQESNVALQMAGSIVVVLPVIVLFFAMQRYIIRGDRDDGDQVRT